MTINEIEKQLPPKHKQLLWALREEGWGVVQMENYQEDWALRQTWLIESTRENSGNRLLLWFFKYNGMHDGMDSVVATPADSEKPSPYAGTPGIHFDGRSFEVQLREFLNLIHELRIGRNRSD